MNDHSKFCEMLNSLYNLITLSHLAFQKLNFLHFQHYGIHIGNRSLGDKTNMMFLFYEDLMKMR